MKINKKFDVVCAFQVLEHLPFDKFEKSLVNMKEHSNKYVIISLPDCRPGIYFKLKIPRIKEIKLSIKLPYYRKIIFDGQHYWEFGGKSTKPSKVLNIIKKHFHIKEEYIIFENPYHHMFVLERK
jgi:2-polyprenyl-3-methyl-5-hydroxy-6-metoxy-1,4-benzoquinol methylase